jgi:hypothetical protein
VDNSVVEGEIIMGSNQDIVHVDEEHARVFVLQGLEQSVHSFLEHRRGVCQAKVHNIWLVQAIRRLERGFMAVFGFDLDVIVAPSNVKCSEECLAL